MTSDQHDRATQAARATAAAQTMKAIVQDEDGEADDVLRLEQID